MFADQFSVLVSYPIAPDKTREELHVFLIGDAATSDDYRDQREATMKMWDDLNIRDLGMLELLQQGRLSPAYDGGRLSPIGKGQPLFWAAWRTHIGRHDCRPALIQLNVGLIPPSICPKRWRI